MRVRLSTAVVKGIVDSGSLGVSGLNKEGEFDKQKAIVNVGEFVRKTTTDRVHSDFDFHDSCQRLLVVR